MGRKIRCLVPQDAGINPFLIGPRAIFLSWLLVRSALSCRHLPTTLCHMPFPDHDSLLLQSPHRESPCLFRQNLSQCNRIIRKASHQLCLFCWSEASHRFLLHSRKGNYTKVEIIGISLGYAHCNSFAHFSVHVSKTGNFRNKIQ